MFAIATNVYIGTYLGAVCGEIRLLGTVSSGGTGWHLTVLSKVPGELESTKIPPGPLHTGSYAGRFQFIDRQIVVH